MACLQVRRDECLAVIVYAGEGEGFCGIALLLHDLLPVADNWLSRVLVTTIIGEDR